MTDVEALAHAERIEIVAFIHKNPNTPVNRIYRALGFEQSATSSHLKKLLDADLVKVIQDGRRRRYSLNYFNISRISRAVNNFHGSTTAI